ncbi:MAG: hypothetical protein ACKODT_08050 [Fluviibacter sp.]
MSDKFVEYSIPIPNPALAEWLRGPECRAAVSEIAQEIFSIYQNTVPVREGNLKRGAYWDVQLGGWGAEKDRYFGIVGNRAVSYRGQKGKPYPRYIEGGTRKMPGQHQLENAVAAVTGDISAGAMAIPGLRYNPKGRGSTLQGPGGKFIRNPLKDTK